MNTINDLRNANRALIEARNNVNFNIAEGQNRLAEINAQLDANNAKIKGNVSRQEQQTMNIGDYAEAIQNAMTVSPRVSGIITAANPRAVEMLNKLVGYVNDNYNESSKKGHFWGLVKCVTGIAVKKGQLDAGLAGEILNIIVEISEPKPMKSTRRSMRGIVTNLSRVAFIAIGIVVSAISVIAYLAL